MHNVWPGSELDLMMVRYSTSGTLCLSVVDTKIEAGLAADAVFRLSEVSGDSSTTAFKIKSVIKILYGAEIRGF